MKFHLNHKYLLVAVLTSSTLLACKPVQEPSKELVRPVRVIEVSAANQIAGAKIPGIAKATQEVELSFRVPGKLSDMPVKIGQEVQIGTVLAELDKRDYKIAINNAKGNLANAKAQLENSRLELKRFIQIQKSSTGVVSQSKIDQKRTIFNSAQALFTSAEAQLHAAEDKFRYATLKAPFEGVVVQRFVENFQDVSANTPIFRLLDLSKIEMDVSVPESRISSLPYATNIRVVFEAFPHIVIPATIKELSNEASKLTRTYNIRLIMTPPPGIDILPGMSGHAMADVNLPDRARDIIVPISALFTSVDNKSTFLWKYDSQSSTVRKVTVEKGTITAQGIPITKGLDTGDLVIVSGVHFLSEGQKVRLLNDTGAAL